MTNNKNKNPLSTVRSGIRHGFTAVMLLGMAPANAFDIVFDYTYDNGFFTNTAKEVLDDAAAFFETRITDDLLAIDSSGSNAFNVNFFNPSNPSSTVTINNFDVAADTLVVFVGGFSSGSSILGLGGYGGYGASGTFTFVTDAGTRGETADTAGVQGSTATDFAPWGGAIGFNDQAPWYFDTDTTTSEGFSGIDFYSVALHELAHVLGFGTADSWDNLVVNSQFTGANATATYGNSSVPLASGNGHWAQGLQSTTVETQTIQETAMDPDIAAGTRKVFTELDLAALEDIGWEISSASDQ